MEVDGARFVTEVAMQKRLTHIHLRGILILPLEMFGVQFVEVLETAHNAAVLEGRGNT